MSISTGMLYPPIYVDATPTLDYPLRILRAYRQLCNQVWSDNTSGNPSDNPLIIQLNELQIKRAEFLDRAIEVLEKEIR